MLKKRLSELTAAIIALTLLCVPVAADELEPVNSVTAIALTPALAVNENIYSVTEDVTVKTMGGIEVVFDSLEVKPGERMTFGITLAEDYVVRGLEIFARDGEKITPIEFDVVGSYRYAFILPQEKTDIMVRSEDHRVVSRAEGITALWHFAGRPTVDFALNYTDVPADSQYAQAICWATSEGLINGTSETEFTPDAPLCREALSVILHRYAGDELDEPICEPLDIVDADFVSPWAANSVAWNLANGILCESGAGYFKPQLETTRHSLDLALRELDEALRKPEQPLDAEEPAESADGEDETIENTLGGLTIG